MDISRCLAEDKSSLSNHHTGSGTMGWTAPEKLLYRRQTCKMDMFSLGCVLFFCFTGGKHPYGDHDERNGNIKKDNKQNMYMIHDFPEAFHLISALLDYDPEKRPTAIDVLNDPMFGDADKKTSEDGGDPERKTLKGASSLAKASGSAKVSQQLDFVESGKSSICRGSTSSDTNDESTCSGIGKLFSKIALERREESTTSSSEVPSLQNQQWIGKKLLVLKTKDIGRGCNGTIVYEGSYEDRPVAVKCLLRSHHKLAQNEIKNLIESDHHQNIIRYHGVQWSRDFIYLALERCLCNLDDLIQIYSSTNQYGCSKTLLQGDRLATLKVILGDFKLYNEIKDRPSPLLLNLMRDVISGLVYLHEHPRIVHRNIRPQNILITKSGPTLCAKLSDMGMCKKLSHDKSSLSNHSTGCASTCWKAPEQLLNQRQTCALDLFSFGCVLFFCITNGKHPFGDPDDCDLNIKRDNKQNMHIIENFPEAFHLISALLEADPKKRPKAIEVWNHPLFWDAEKRLSFLRDTSNKESENDDLFKALKCTARSVLGAKSKGKEIQAWDKNMDDKIIIPMCLYITKNYNFYSVRDLLQLIQNMLNKYEQLPKDIQILVGHLYEGFDDYFTSRFPKLLIEVYKVVCEYCKEEDYFRKYFKANM